MSLFQDALKILRARANNTIELGSEFERLAKVFFENDKSQTQQFSQVWHYKDWTKLRSGFSNHDIGIDLVAKLRDEEGYCAIQCKFYQNETHINKSDLDSFISASANPLFTRLILIDTSIQPIGSNANSVISNLGKYCNRIQISELEQSLIDWMYYIREGDVRFLQKKDPHDHQIEALKAVKKGLDQQDRGKMIMACGTGKTYTSLLIAEELAGPGKTVLYMVPSLSLMSQTIREWKNDATVDFTAFSACSDIKVGKKQIPEDQIEISLNDLAFPATTDASKLAEKIKIAKKSKMIVVFSTYHSIDVISKSQYKYDLDKFDLIICDEAHRTTGATLVGVDESNFVKIHDNEFVMGKKRLYMTATPRIYGETAKKKADKGEFSLASMDNEDVYGNTLFEGNFGWAVERNLLTDYKVIVLAMDEQHVSDRVQKVLTKGSEIKLDDANKMVGCYKALAKIGISSKKNTTDNNHQFMQRALVFCQSIKKSKAFAREFSTVVEQYHDYVDANEYQTDLNVEVDHVDGTLNAEKRNERLNWLKKDAEENVCRILSNVRCLSEGVDVPALDAIIFLHPRNSQIDVVQSVGRVMRKAKGKKMGYVILPITIASGVTPEKALSDNKKFKVIWQTLNALRAHDESFESTINRIRFGEDVSDKIEIIDGTKIDEIEKPPFQETEPNVTKLIDEDEISKPNIEEVDEDDSEPEPEPKTKPIVKPQISFVFEKYIYAKIVQKCGERGYWENWATDIADIAQKHITRINSIVLISGTPAHNVFTEFVNELRDDLNPCINEIDAIEMLAQHIITRPVFDTLFKNNKFSTQNAVSKAMERVLSSISDSNISTESETLDKFYDSIKQRADSISTARARQALIVELYEKFFSNAFPLMTAKLGIVYTPVEIVDFIIHSVENVMKDEFGSSIGDKGVHIIDPFSGTGTFISRLLQLDVLSPKQIRRKFKTEIHANEIVLLAYYIACINIEAAYEDKVGNNKYQSFDGMVLTDTFQLFEQERDMIAKLLPDNSERRTKQKNRDITVVIGNPPYSAGQSQENDNAKNIKYENLDSEIRSTYAADSTSTNKNALYDSYIRAFKWASDRIGDEGVIGFVSNSGWIEGNSTDGMRKHLHMGFSKVYIINLRGNINKNISSMNSSGEGENVFGMLSKTGIAITILIKNVSNTDNKILYYDIGDNKSKNEKLSIIKDFNSIKGIELKNKFSYIKPDKNNDWLKHRDITFNKYIHIGNKKDKASFSLFKNYSSGLKTNRDAWCYNYSENKLYDNIKMMINFFNTEIDRFDQYGLNKSDASILNNDLQKINWTTTLKQRFSYGKKIAFADERIFNGIYRPFTLSKVYFHRSLNERFYQQSRLFPQIDSKNIVICITGIGASTGFSCLMTDRLPNYHTLDTGQCFPLYLYQKDLKEDNESFAYDKINPHIKEIAISDDGYSHFKEIYKGEKFSKEELFYYIYGILHSPEYRNRFSNNLAKELPRIPAVKSFYDFVNFSDSGRKLSDLHVNFDTAVPFHISFKEDIPMFSQIDKEKEFYRVLKMKFGPNGKSSVIYNNNITIQNIPLEAYDYVVNGKSAIEWVMYKQRNNTNDKKPSKASGIINDANDWGNETKNNPAYPLKLFQSVITVSLETMKIVKALPKLDID